MPCGCSRFRRCNRRTRSSLFGQDRKICLETGLMYLITMNVWSSRSWSASPPIARHDQSRNRSNALLSVGYPALAQALVPPPGSCAQMKWGEPYSSGSYVHPMLVNNCPRTVYGYAELAGASNDYHYNVTHRCPSGNTCRQSVGRSHPGFLLGFTYCLEYADYDLRKEYGSCN